MKSFAANVMMIFVFFSLSRHKYIQKHIHIDSERDDVDDDDDTPYTPTRRVVLYHTVYFCMDYITPYGIYVDVCVCVGLFTIIFFYSRRAMCTLYKIYNFFLRFVRRALLLLLLLLLLPTVVLVVAAVCRFRFSCLFVACSTFNSFSPFLSLPLAHSYSVRFFFAALPNSENSNV